MTLPYVSVHMIVKENTNLGAKFLDGAFHSLREASYPNEIILVDNGSADFIHDKVYSIWKEEFKNVDCDLKIIKSDLSVFCDLRNLCIENTSKSSDFIHWIDSDEIYYPEDLDFVKQYIMPQEGIKMIWSYFYHFMINPFNVQINGDAIKSKRQLNLMDYLISKDNIFAYTKDLRWKGGVHEHLFNQKDGRVVDNTESKLEYLHYGYTKLQWKVFLKWLRYDMIEHGHVNGYKKENIDIDSEGDNVLHSGKPKVKQIQKDYLRDWRDPNNICWDRIPFSRPYPDVVMGTKDHLPEGAIKLIGSCKTPEDWNKYLNSIDDISFWDWWQALYKKEGSWCNTLDAVVERCQKENWSSAW